MTAAALQAHEDEKRELERQFQEELHNIRKYYEKRLRGEEQEEQEQEQEEEQQRELEHNRGDDGNDDDDGDAGGGTESSDNEDDDHVDETEFVSADGFSDADYQAEEMQDEDNDDNWEAIVAARVEEQVRQREAEWNEFAVEIEQVSRHAPICTMRHPPWLTRCPFFPRPRRSSRNKKPWPCCTRT